MSKVSRCYVHIGAPKTGTTYLQKVFFENREMLVACGLLYPDANLRGFGHHDVAYLLNGGYPIYATAQDKTLGQIETMLATAVQGHRGSIVLSSENFYLFPNPRELLKLLEKTGCLDERQIAIIVYLRRQDEAHESWYNQTIKAQGLTHDLRTCIEASFDIWDYRKQLAAWAAVVGEGALIVRPYERAQFAGGSLITDFLGICNVSSENLHYRDELVNSGLNRDLLEFQRIVNKLPMEAHEKRRFHRQLIDLSARCAGTGLFREEPVMDANLRRSVLERYASGNSEVARRYLGVETLFRAEPIEMVNARVSSEPQLSVEKIALILGWLLSRDDIS